MKVLVMGDCHLKPWMFKRAEELMEEYEIEVLVFIGDLVDDWKKQYSIEAYIDTMDVAIAFFKHYPKSIYIIGNHDISYLWQQRETGYSPVAGKTVIEKFKELSNILPQNNQPVFIKSLEYMKSQFKFIEENKNRVCESFSVNRILRSSMIKY